MQPERNFPIATFLENSLQDLLRLILLHRIRLAMQQGTFEKLSGHVEADETFIGGKARNMHIAQRRSFLRMARPIRLTTFYYH
ncbi:MAG: hypothetical protein AABN33_01885 [Acidobacteriota bacterium]